MENPYFKNNPECPHCGEELTDISFTDDEGIICECGALFFQSDLGIGERTHTIKFEFLKYPN